MCLKVAGFPVRGSERAIFLGRPAVDPLPQIGAQFSVSFSRISAMFALKIWRAMAAESFRLQRTFRAGFGIRSVGYYIGHLP